MLYRTLSVAIDQGMREMRQDFVIARADGDREKIIQWLACTDSSLNHNAAHNKHQPGTGEWFIKGPNMEKWKTTQSSLLWLHGIRQSSLFPHNLEYVN
jgi:hypothetical protein